MARAKPPPRPPPLPPPPIPPPPPPTAEELAIAQDFADGLLEMIAGLIGTPGVTLSPPALTQHSTYFRFVSASPSIEFITWRPPNDIAVVGFQWLGSSAAFCIARAQYTSNSGSLADSLGNLIGTGVQIPGDLVCYCGSPGAQSYLQPASMFFKVQTGQPLYMSKNQAATPAFILFYVDL